MSQSQAPRGGTLEGPFGVTFPYHARTATTGMRWTHPLYRLQKTVSYSNALWFRDVFCKPGGWQLESQNDIQSRVSAGLRQRL